MVTARITPKVIAVGMACQLLLYAALYVPALLPYGWLIAGVVRAGGGVIAYGAALALNLEVAAEYRRVRWLRLAWLALAANAGLSLFRPVITSPLLYTSANNSTISPLPSLLNHLLVVPANAFLLIGMIAMCWSYHRVGLGFRIERRDYAVIAGFLSLMLMIVFFHDGLSEARSPYPVSRYLQVAGFGLISAATVVGVVLHRLAIQMGGGWLAAALRWLVAYVILRHVLVLVDALRQSVWSDAGPEWALFNQILSYLIALLWQVVPWTVALAAAHRAQLTVSAARELEQQQQWAARGAITSVS